MRDEHEGRRRLSTPTYRWPQPRFSLSRALILTGALIILLGVVFVLGHVPGRQPRAMNSQVVVASVQNQFRTCLRQHGYPGASNVTVTNEESLRLIPPDDLNACGWILAKLPSSPHPVPPAEKKRLIAYQQCMVRHGFHISVEFSEASGYTINFGTAFTQPGFHSADVACDPPKGLFPGPLPLPTPSKS